MPSFEIRSFKGGISDYEDKGIPGAFKFAQAADIRKDRDSLSCQQALANETVTGLDALVSFFVPASDGKLYAFTKSGKIFMLSSGTWSLVYTETQESGNIIGAGEFAEGTQSFLYWATATRLNRKPLPGLSNWTDVNTGGSGSWPKTNLTSTSWHTMALVNGTFLICNDQFLGQVSYTDSSYTNQALNLIQGNIAKTLMESGKNALIGCTRKDLAEEGHLFLWDQITDNWGDKKIFPASGINAMIDIGVPLYQIGTNGAVYYAADELLPLFSFPGGGQVNPGGVENDESVALFGVYGNTGKSGIYTYGRKKLNASRVLNLDYPITADEISAVVKYNGTIYVSYKSGSNYYIKKVNSAAKQQAIYQSIDLKAPSKYTNIKVPTWTKAVLTTAPLPTGCSIEVWRRLDKVTTGGPNNDGWFQANMQGSVTQYTTTGAKEAVFLIGDKAKIAEVQFILNPYGNTTPEIYKAEIFFE